MNKLIVLIKNKPILSSLVLIILANGFTELPLRNYLSNFMSYQTALMVSILALQMSCFGFLAYLSRRLNFYDSFNMKLYKPAKSLWIAIPFFLLILLNGVGNIKLEYIAANPLTFVLYFFAFLSTGFFEEILFRGILFNLINNKFGSNNKGFYFSLFISSFIFGACHITHLLDGTMPLLNFLNQMFYASVIGVLFTALYLRCNTLLVPILIHGLIDITGCTEFLSITSKELYFQSLMHSPITYKTIVGNLIIFLPLLIWGIFLLRKNVPSSQNISSEITI